jgi:enolase
MTHILSFTAIEILDSRSNPTIEATCTLTSGATGCASVPSGKSTGAHEAFEKRDGDMSRYNGMGVLKAVDLINTEISDHVSRKEFDQQSLDTELSKLDGTPDKSRLGANATLAVSLAFARACAQENNVELYQYIKSLAGGEPSSTLTTLPVPMFNIINGGKHANSGLDIQEFLICPVGVQKFEDRVNAGVKIISTLKDILENRGYSTEMGDEGGFAPKLSSNAEALDLLTLAIEQSGYNTDQIRISIDAASTSFYDDSTYTMKMNGVSTTLTPTELSVWYKKMIHKYNLLSIEDPFEEEDFESFAHLLQETKGEVKIIGDDLTVTNTERIAEAHAHRSINGVIIKLNQIGTLSETLRAVALAQSANDSIVISHRSGETLDTFISDLAVAVGADFIKSGSLTKKERVVKYNRIIEIEKGLE